MSVSVAPIRVVVDTVIWLDQAGSGIAGSLLWSLMEQRPLVPVVSQDVYREFERKMLELVHAGTGGRQLSLGECRSLLLDYIRMAEQWDEPPASGLPVGYDDDVPFVDLLVDSQADALITRDRDLLRLAGDLPVMTLSDFMFSFGFAPDSPACGL